MYIILIHHLRNVFDDEFFFGVIPVNILRTSFQEGIKIDSHSASRLVEAASNAEWEGF